MSDADDPGTPLTRGDLCERAAFLYHYSRTVKGVKLTYETCAEKVGIEEPVKEAENVRKRAAKYRGKREEEFEDADWLVEVFRPGRRDASAAAELSEDDKAALDRAALLWARCQLGLHDYLVTEEGALQGSDLEPTEANILALRAAAARHELALRAELDDRDAADATDTSSDDDDGAVDVGKNRRGAGKGRPKKDPAAAADAAPKYKGVGKEEYLRLTTDAARRIADVPEGERWRLAKTLADELMAQGCEVSTDTLYRVSQDPDKPRTGLGGRYFSDAFEADLASMIRYIRSYNGPVTAEEVIIWAKAELQRNGTEKYLPNITKGWFYRFAGRHGFLSGSSRPIDETRAAWCTSPNAKR